jgi:hypothetical protein
MSVDITIAEKTGKKIKYKIELSANTVAESSILYFNFSPGSLLYGDVCRRNLIMNYV